MSGYLDEEFNEISSDELGADLFDFKTMSDANTSEDYGFLVGEIESNGSLSPLDY